MALSEEERIMQMLELRQKKLRLEAPENFASFLKYCIPGYHLKWFHKVIADHCQMLYEGKIQNLMIFIPPQHGKSTVVSEAFPAWLLGRNPRMKIVGSSYASSLACKVSRNIQRIMDSPRYRKLFPDTYLNGKGNSSSKVRGYLRNVDIFETVGYGGFYKAVGVGGGLTGTPVDISIIDDPVKDAMEAYSVTFRERVWDWYSSVLMTRLHNESRQLFIMTRWHDDDLAGRILKYEPERWTVLKIPAIRESLEDGNEFDPRNVGEALWPDKHALERLLDARQRSARFFAALYQQSPTIEGGNIIKSSWLTTIPLATFKRIKLATPIHFFIDTAFTEKTTNDPTGIIGICVVNGTLYITCAKKVNMKFPELIRFIPAYVKENGYTPRSSIRIEPKANGLSVIDQLRELTNLNVVATPTPRESKETRLNAVSPFVESGHVVLVDAPWNDIFIDEVCGFPAKPHDEFVDLLCYAVNFCHNTVNRVSDADILRDLL